MYAEYVSQQEKEDVIRALFYAKGWKRDGFGSMKKGALKLVFVFNKVRLKKLVKGEWRTIKVQFINTLYERFK